MSCADDHFRPWSVWSGYLSWNSNLFISYSMCECSCAALRQNQAMTRWLLRADQRTDGSPVWPHQTLSRQQRSLRSLQAEWNTSAITPPPVNPRCHLITAHSDEASVWPRSAACRSITVLRSCSQDDNNTQWQDELCFSSARAVWVLERQINERWRKKYHCKSCRMQFIDDFLH